MPTTTEVVAYRMMTEGGAQRVPIDSGLGRVSRPFATSVPGARTAPLETLYDFFINNVPDPDTALAQDPNFDEKLRQQPDVHACMRIRELTVASLPAPIEPSRAKGINKDFSQSVAEYTTDVMDALPNRIELYRHMQNAVLRGGQGVEFVWWKVGGYERPVSFSPIDKGRFVFDRLGNMAILTRQTPVWGSYVAPAPARFPDEQKAWPSPGGKFIYHKYMAEGGSFSRPASEGYVYWGRGEDTNLFIPVTFDQFALRFHMKWLERFGFPLTILYHPDTEGISGQVLQICESIRGESVARIPRPSGQGEENAFYKVELLSPPTGTINAFQAFHDQWTTPRIEKILLGGANLLELGDVGSYGATVNQAERGSEILFRYDAKNIDETLNQQLIPYIVQARFPGCPPTYYPKHSMAPEKKEDKEVLIDVLTRTAEAVPVRAQDFYDAAGLQRPKGLPEDFFDHGEEEEDGEEAEPYVFLGQRPGEEPMFGDEFPPLPGQPSATEKRKLERAQEKKENGKSKNGKATPIGKGRRQ